MALAVAMDFGLGPTCIDTGVEAGLVFAVLSDGSYG